MLRLLRLFAVSLTACAFPVAAMDWDFTGSRDPQGWTPAHDIAAPEPSPDGLVLRATGADPFLHSPRGDFSGDGLVFYARLKSDAAGWVQVFFSQNSDREARSSHVAVRAGWNEIAVPMQPLGPGARLRLDFPGRECVLARASIEKTGARGVTAVRVEKERIVLRLAGVRGEVEIVMTEPHHQRTDEGAVVWSGAAAGEVVLPRLDGQKDRIACGFAVRGVGGIRFAEQFADIARDTRPFPALKNRKGLQVQLHDDALALGIRHAGVNVSIGAVFDPAKRATSPQWTVDGETFYFRRSYLERLGVKRLSDAGVNVYLILLGYETGDTALNSRMLHPGRDTTLVNKMAAPNLTTAEGVRLWRAAFEFLADWFSRDENGHAVGYIIGNEVNVHSEWHNMGRVPRSAAVAEVARWLRLANTSVRRTSASARVYLSLTHFWTLDPGRDHWRSLPGRYFIEEMARTARAGGDFDWHLAHHPYPENLFNPRAWTDKTAPPNFDAPRITPRNLEQLDAFIAQPTLHFRGTRRSIILSEQGFHSTGDAEGDHAQAAGFCYTWEKIEQLAGVDAFILHRHVDHRMEGGLNLGLWSRKPGSTAEPATPRPMYECFKAAATPAQGEVFERYRALWK